MNTKGKATGASFLRNPTSGSHLGIVASSVRPTPASAPPPQVAAAAAPPLSVGSVASAAASSSASAGKVEVMNVRIAAAGSVIAAKKFHVAKFPAKGLCVLHCA
jgi:hypothetical protein